MQAACRRANLQPRAIEPTSLAGFRSYPDGGIAAGGTGLERQWLTYLNEREVESSFWILPTAGHYPQREKPERVAKIVRLALSGGVPDREAENDFMRSYGRSREADDAVFVGHSVVRKMEFPGSVRYTPEGYQ